VRVAVSLALLVAANVASADSSHFRSWPRGKSPQEIGRRLTERFLATPHPNFEPSKPTPLINYHEVCAWVGALRFAKVAKQPRLTQSLVDRFTPLFGREMGLIPKPQNVDWTVFGAIPLEIYLQRGGDPYLEMGRTFADRQWEPPKPEERKNYPPKILAYIDQGLSRHTRFWIDDMYMITMIQAQAYRATKDPKYVDRAAREMTVYLKELQQPNGLFFHAPDAPHFWGRGNGWMAAGMAELLRALPARHPDRAPILAGYQKMMATLLRHQGADGMWRQLVDDPEAWNETSCTGMFTFAMVTGVKQGWLDAKTYGPAARRGWLALTEYIDPNGDVREVCIGTNKDPRREHYLQRPRTTGDMHGQAPALWSAAALLE
jgi:rhamnogalacturonyl hydrolase YesR